MSSWPGGSFGSGHSGGATRASGDGSTGSLADPDVTFDDDDALNASLVGIGSDDDPEAETPTLRSLAAEDEDDFDLDPSVTGAMPQAATGAMPQAAPPAPNLLTPMAPTTTPLGEPEHSRWARPSTEVRPGTDTRGSQPDAAPSHVDTAFGQDADSSFSAPASYSAPAEHDDAGLDPADLSAAEGTDPRGAASVDEVEASLDMFSRDWSPASGFADPQGTVRIWLDDQQRISRVRLSPNWRERLHGTRGLEMVFTVVFLAINEHIPAEVPMPALALDDETRQARHPLSWEAMNALHQRDQELLEQLADLPPEGYGRWVGDQAVGHSREGSTSIALTPQGQLQSVHFSKSFVDEAPVEAIEASVIEAHRDAQAHYEPPVYEPGEADRLTNALQENRLELLAMMRRGFQ